MKPVIVQLRRPLERAIASGHPWIYREALDRPPSRPGDVVTVRDTRGRFLARGFSDAGPIAVRVWTTRDEPLDRAMVQERVRSALALRSRIIPADTDAYRLVHGEGDRTPGLVCDRYGPQAILRYDSAGLSTIETWVLEVLEEAGVEAVALRGGRGDSKSFRPLLGSPAPDVTALERGMRLAANLREGQKTGLFLDHRDSRWAVRRLSAGLRVLNLYGYTGGFSVAAGLGGAIEVETVDVSKPALQLAERSWALNALPPTHRAVASDVPKVLAAYREARRQFDLVVADPPSFAPSEKALRGALRSYGKLHEACLRLLAPGGLYLAASCSSHVSRNAFRDSLQEGARRARAFLQVLGEWGAAPDHPRLVGFDEGDYLKVVLTRRL